MLLLLYTTTTSTLLSAPHSLFAAAAAISILHHSSIHRAAFISGRSLSFPSLCLVIFNAIHSFPRQTTGSKQQATTTRRHEQVRVIAVFSLFLLFL